MFRAHCLTHQVLECVAHEFLLQNFNQSHLNGVLLILNLTVWAEPLRQDGAVLRTKFIPIRIITQDTGVELHFKKILKCFLSGEAYLCHWWVLAEVQVPTEVTVVADDFRQDVGVTRITELGLLWKLPDVHETQEVPLQFVHLIHNVGIEWKDLTVQNTKWNNNKPYEQQMRRAVGKPGLTWQTYLTNSRAGLFSGRCEPGRTGNSSEVWVTFLDPVTFLWIFWVMVKMFCVSSLATYSWEKEIMPGKEIGVVQLRRNSLRRD